MKKFIFAKDLKKKMGSTILYMMNYIDFKIL